MIKVREERKSKIYIHNDLMNTAFHLKKNVLRLEEQGESGITLHIMGALTILAFAFEAQLNFMGHKKVDGWDERESFKDKKKSVFKVLKIGSIHNKRPYSSITKLKKFRDTLAHGKPIEEHHIEEKEIYSDDDFNLRTPHEYEELCTVKHLSEIYEDVGIIWKEMLKSSGLDVSDTITVFSGGRTIIENKN